MSARNEKEAAKWRETRKMGKGKYVFIYGVLLWGILFAAIFTAIEWISQHTFSTAWLYIRLAVFGVVGFFIANFRWDAKEIKLREFDKLDK